MADPTLAGDVLELALLGPVELQRNGELVPLAGQKSRALITLLALRANTVVSADRLIDALWPDELGEQSKLANLLQVNVRNLRRVIELDPGSRPTRLVTQAPGYRLVLHPDELDVDTFERGIADARLACRSDDPAGGIRAYEIALARWRGPALDDLAAHEWAQSDAVRLDELRFAAVEELTDLRLARGEHVALVSELEALVREQPLREHLWAQLLLALYRSGRQAEALRAFQQARETLLDELGIDPGPELRQLETAILQHDESLLPELSNRGWPTNVATTPTSTADSGAERPLPRAELPMPVTAMVGREHELARIEALLTDPTRRLVTLTGPGGVGKTRLALEVAHRARRDGRSVVFCGLDEVVDPALVLPTVARSLGVEEHPREAIATTIARAIGATPHLIVIDNLEQLLGARAVLADLLTATAVQILATSRTALRLTAEIELAVAPLATGTLDAPGPALQLLVERTNTVNANFADRERHALVALCDRMDGLPLAIELAAPLARLFDAGELVAQWDRITTDSLGGTDDLRPARHRTIGATTEWSLSLLGDAARGAAMELSVFRGPFTVDDAVSVLTTPDAVAALGELVDHSVLLRDATSPPRFRLLRSVRRALDDARPATIGEDRDESVRRRHADLIARRIAAAPVAIDDDDSRAALESALELGDVDLATRIVVARIEPWIRVQAFTEATSAVARALDLCAVAPAPALDAAAGSLAEARDDFVAARFHLERALVGYHAADDGNDHGADAFDAVLDVLTDLASVAMLQGEFERVEELLRQAHELPGTPIARFADYVEAWLCEERGDLGQARSLFEAHLDSARMLGRADEVAYAYVTLAELEALDGELERADELLLAAEAATPPGEAVQLDCYRARLRGMIALQRGAPATAARELEGALGLALELGRACELSWCLDGIAASAAAIGADEDAAILFAAGSALRDATGAANPRTERLAYGPYRDAALVRLGPQRVERLTRLAGRLAPAAVVDRARQAANATSQS